MKILTVIVVLVVVYALFTGLGLRRVFKKGKTVTKTLVINDFEYPYFPNDDFSWTTNGYVKMEPATENQSHGKRSAKVSFYSTQQFYPTPVPGVDPMNSSHVFYTKSGETSWRPEIILNKDSPTRLPFFEWQDYTQFKMDVFNPQDIPVTYHIKIADSHTFVFETSGLLTPKKITNIVVPLEDLQRVRLDLSNIQSFKFSADLAGAPDPLVLYLDNLHLEGEVGLVKKAAVKTTPTPGGTPVNPPASPVPSPTAAPKKKV
jgi:hypothetical protein